MVTCSCCSNLPNAALLTAVPDPFAIFGVVVDALKLSIFSSIVSEV